MRIIAGRHRGRPILGPDSPATRPITDRAKQSLFDILAPRIEGAVVYDLFAGTGSMGLECLSRDAARVTFFERDRAALTRLHKNLATLGEQKSATVLDKDVFRWFGTSSPDSRLAGEPARRVFAGEATVEDARPEDTRRAGSPAKHQHADIIFLDPPYSYVRERAGELQSLAHSLATHHLKIDGVLIFRHDRADTLDLPGLTTIDQRTYGSMAIDLLQPAAALADEKHT